jgi:hypothetical protein
VNASQYTRLNSQVEPLLTVEGRNGVSNNQLTQADPFDPMSLRLDQSFLNSGAVKKLLTTVPVRKPNRQDFVRVRPDEKFRLSPAAIIELKEDRETYLVPPAMALNLEGEFTLATLYLAINCQGVVFLWPVKLPKTDGRRCDWHISAAEAAERAMSKWIRIKSNMDLGAYEIFEAENQLADPIWPDLPLSDILKIAFKGRLIDTLDHPVVQKLRGLI